MDDQRHDFELLREFSRCGDQSAFALVVRRHLDLVFGTALRKLGDAGGAEEVTQDVFAALARNTWRFAAGDSVPAWLHYATLLKAKAWWRGEIRRRRREQTAAELGTTMNTPDDQSAIRPLIPLLDEALLALREKDRVALLLRFYERQPFRDVGAAMGVSEDAAQKRVAAALENLANFFRRRGHRMATAAASAAALQHTAISAPAGFAGAMAQVALTASPPALAGWAANLTGLLGKTQVASLCAVVLVAPAAWQWNSLQGVKQDAALAQAKLEVTRVNLVAAQTDLARRQAESMRMAVAIDALAYSQDRNAQAASKLGELKARLHGLLASADAGWPDDLPYVRVPRTVVDDINVGQDPVDPSGILSDAEVQLLGLTPSERFFAESHLSEYFQKASDLASRGAYETNSNIKSDGWVTKTIAVRSLTQDCKEVWKETGEPVMTMIGNQRRLQFSGCWMTSVWCDFFCDQQPHPLSQWTLAVKPDGTDNPQYSLLSGGVALDGNLPIHGTLPGFLRDRFEPWLQSLGIYSVDTGHP